MTTPIADHPVSPIAAGTVPWPEDLAQAYTAAGWWREQALGTEVLAAADARPAATAVVDGATRLSYASLAARADVLASRLIEELGLRRGDRIVVQLPNGWEFVVLMLACLRAGIVPVMALPTHRQHELAYLCEHSEARALAVPGVLRDFDHQEMAARLRAGSPYLRQVLVAGGDVRPGHAALTALCAEPAAPGDGGQEPGGRHGRGGQQGEWTDRRRCRRSGPVRAPLRRKGSPAAGLHTHCSARGVQQDPGGRKASRGRGLRRWRLPVLR